MIGSQAEITQHHLETLACIARFHKVLPHLDW
jgi:hypothetical protein